MKKASRSRFPEPAVGTVFYEVGFKRDKPCAPVIISWVYGGRIREQDRDFHLLIEFSRAFTPELFQEAVRAQRGLKIPSLQQLYEGRETWAEVVRWTRRCAKGWRNVMNE